jgi:hypothetical protein
MMMRVLSRLAAAASVHYTARQYTNVISVHAIWLSR